MLQCQWGNPNKYEEISQKDTLRTDNMKKQKDTMHNNTVYMQ